MSAYPAGTLFKLRRRTFWVATAVCVLGASGTSCTASDDVDPDQEEWISLFNGIDLDGWVVKIAGHDLNANFGNTFRVQDSILTVRYDGYETFDDQFGHLFFNSRTHTTGSWSNTVSSGNS